MSIASKQNRFRHYGYQKGRLVLVKKQQLSYLENISVSELYPLLNLKRYDLTNIHVINSG